MTPNLATINRANRSVTRATVTRKPRKKAPRPAITSAQRAVFHVLKRFGAMTDAQLVEQYPVLSQHLGRPYPAQTPSGLRTRRSELVSLGYVKDTGLTVGYGRSKRTIWAGV